MAIRFRYEDIDLGKPLEGLIYEKRDQIAYITINRPDKGNSLTKKMEQIFRAIWAEVREDPEIRVAIVSAVGDRHFSTGFDVSSVDESGSVANNLPCLLYTSDAADEKGSVGLGGRRLLQTQL